MLHSCESEDEWESLTKVLTTLVGLFRGDSALSFSFGFCRRPVLFALPVFLTHGLIITQTHK